MKGVNSGNGALFWKWVNISNLKKYYKKVMQEMSFYLTHINSVCGCQYHVLDVFYCLLFRLHDF